MEGKKMTTKITNEDKLKKFLSDHFDETRKQSSANTINQFAELVFHWFNDVYENQSLVLETIEQQIYSMVKYNKGGKKDTAGFVIQEINLTFENNVNSAVKLAHLWYSKENKDVKRNTTNSNYFYIKNDMMMIRSEFSNHPQKIKDKNKIVRLPLNQVDDFYNKVFKIDKGTVERKNLVKILEQLNDTLYKKLIVSNVLVDNETNTFDIKYNDLAKKLQGQSEEAINLSKNLIQITSFFTDLLNYLDDENNVAKNGDVLVSTDTDNQVKLFVGNQIYIANQIEEGEKYKVEQKIVNFTPSTTKKTGTNN